MMRKVTSDKLFAIRKVKSMFQGRLKYLIKAKDYEVRCDRQFAV